MKYKELSIKGGFLVFTKKHEDRRGSFLRVYDQRVFKKIIPKKTFFKIPSLPKTKIEFINEFNFKKNYGIIICTASHSKVNKILNKYNHSGQRFYL